MAGWLRGDPDAAFENWRKRLPKAKPKPASLLPLPPPPSSSSSSATTPIAKLVKESLAKKEANVRKPAKLAMKNKPELRKTYLIQKYGRRWVEKFYKIDTTESVNFDSKELSWLKTLLFCPGSVQTRTFSAGLLKDLSQNPERRLKVVYTLEIIFT